MIRHTLLVSGLALIASTALLAAEPTTPGKGKDSPAAPPDAPATAKEPDEADKAPPPSVDVDADWHARADKWFTAPESDQKARKKEMKAITRALKQPCRYCHTKDWSGYQPGMLRLGQQMMAMSVEHGVECKDCHAGKDALTKLGEASVEMWRLSIAERVFCDECHTPGKRFEALTAAGQRRAQEWKKNPAAREKYRKPAP